MMTSRKKFFDVLYLSNNINNNVVEIFLSSPITYKDYFCLTKLIHSAFINHQFGINNFIQTNNNSVFLNLSNLLVNYSLISIYNVSFSEIKKCLTQLKKQTISHFKIVKDYNEAINNERILNFIEDLANSDARYKNGSIRQIKSHYIRQSQLYKKNYCNLVSREIFIDSSSLIFKYYEKIKQLCHQSYQQSNTFQNTEEASQKISPPTQNSEISILTDSEQFSLTRVYETITFPDLDFL